MYWRLLWIGVLIAARGWADAEYDAWVARFVGSTNYWFVRTGKDLSRLYMSDGFANEQSLVHQCSVDTSGEGLAIRSGSISTTSAPLPQLSILQLARLNQLLASLPTGLVHLPAPERRLTLRSVVNGTRVVKVYDLGKLPEPVLDLLETTGCARSFLGIIPWVPAFPPQSQWTEMPAGRTATMNGQQIILNSGVSFKSPYSTDLDKSVVSPSGRYAVSGGPSGTVYLRIKADGGGGIVLYKDAFVTSFAFSQDESKVAIATGYGSSPLIQVWTTSEGRVLTEIRLYRAFEEVSAMVWSPQDEYLLVAGGAQVGLWNVATARLRAALQGCGSGWRGIGLGADGTFIETCGDRMIRQWDLTKILAEIR